MLVIASLDGACLGPAARHCAWRVTRMSCVVPVCRAPRATACFGAGVAARWLPRGPVARPSARETVMAAALSPALLHAILAAAVQQPLAMDGASAARQPLLAPPLALLQLLHAWWRHQPDLTR